MYRPLFVAFAALAATSLCAQETYWVANRASNDLMRVTAWGSVVERVPMGTSLRSAHVAPDGRVWVVRFIQSTVDIYDPATGTMTAAAFSLGSAYDIAFDAAGTAWISGGTGVENFDATGMSLQTFPLAVASPLGITIDNQGNKWIAHRVGPASVTRIDTSGTIVNFPITGSTMLPVRVTADYQGFLATTPSHIWVTGDSAGELAELDGQGNTLNVYTLPITSTGGVGPVFDLNGHIWVGSYGNGALVELDPANGAILSNLSLPPSINGLGVDTLGRILATARITFSGVGPPCEVRRVDPVSGLLEMTTYLAYGGNNAAGTQSAVSTPFAYSLVVDPLGDLDGDSEVNFSEIEFSHSSPTDPCSTSIVALSTSGNANATTGGAAYFDVRVDPTTFWLLGFAFGYVPAGSGISVPGLTCEVRLNPLRFLGSGSGVGPQAVSFMIPADPALIGVEFTAQAIAITAANSMHASNLAGLLLW